MSEIKRQKNNHKSANILLSGYKNVAGFLSVQKKHWKKAFAVFLLIATISSAVFFNGTGTAQAAAFTFNQTDWSGGQTANTAVHPSNESGWNQYSAKDASMTAVNAGADLQISATAAVLSGRTDVTQNFAKNSYTDYNNARKIAIAPNGTIYIAYYSTEYYNGISNIALRSSADNFVSRTDITTMTSGGAFYPSISVDSNNFVHIAYQSYEYNASYLNIAYRNNISGNFNTRVNVTANSNSNSYNPSLALDSGGKAHIAYQSFEYSVSYYNIEYRNNVSGNFNTRVDVSANAYRSSLNSSLALDANGKAHIAYQSTEYNLSWYNIAYRNNVTDNFVSKIDVTANSNSNSYSPSLALDANGKAHIAYHSQEYNASFYNIAYRNNVTDNFVSRVNVTANASVIAQYPSIAVDASGKAHVAYYSKEYSSGYFNIAYRNNVSDNFVSRADVTTNASGVTNFPSIVLDTNGKAHIAYQSQEYNSSYYNIAYRNNVLNNFVARTDVTQNFAKNSYTDYNNARKIAIAPNGTVYIVYYSTEYNPSFNNIALRSSADNFASRTDITTLTSTAAMYPSIAIDANNFVHIAYQSSEYSAGQMNIAYRNNISGNFNTRVDVTANASLSSYNPSLVVDANGKAHIAYNSYEYSGGSRYNIAYRNNISGNFNTRIDVTTSYSANSSFPSLVLDSNGKAHIAYHSNEYNSNTNIAYRNNISGNFNTRVDVTTNIGLVEMYPSLAIDSSGKVHIVYQSTEYSTGYYNIAYRNNVSGNFNTRVDVTTISSNFGNAYYPSIGIDSNGYIHVAYDSNEHYSGWLNIAYRNNISGNFNTRVDVTNNSSAANPSLVLDSSGKAHIAYDSYEYSGSSIYNIAYETYAPSRYATQTLTSSAYDSGSLSNLIGGLSWNEDATLPTGTGVTISLRTASSSAGLAAASWSDLTNATPYCTKSVTTVTCSVAAIPAAMQDGSGDQWFQYKATLVSSGQYTPTLSDVTVTYVVNASPTVAIAVTPSQTAGTGKVDLTYNIQNGGSGQNAEPTDTFNTALFYTTGNGAGLTLTSDITSSATTVGVTGTDGQYLPAAGFINIDSEVIRYSAKSGSGSSWTLTGNSGFRGDWPVDGRTSVASAHTAGAAIYAQLDSASITTVSPAGGTGIGDLKNAAGATLQGDSINQDYTISWDSETDANFGDRYVSQLKLKAFTNDNNVVNQTGSAETPSYLAVDTASPTAFVFNIDHNAAQLNFTVSPTDDSSFQMGVSNIAGTFPTFTAFTSPLAYANLTADPATVYVRVKDDYGNYTDVQATTPAKPENLVYFDTSNAPVFQEFIAWDVIPLSQTGSGFAGYKVYRQINSGPFTLLATVVDRNTNYFLDKIKGADTESDPSFDPNNPSTYTYKITAVDTNGDSSLYSTTVSDTPNGTGGSDSTPPTIVNVQVPYINTTSAKITWTTDELSDSSVGYSSTAECVAAPGQVCPYLPERGLASMVTDHEIMLTNLTPDTTYHIHVKSHDQIGNLGQNDKDAPGSSPIPNFTFTTHPGPAISGVSVSSNNYHATISWATTTDSNTMVTFSDTSSGGALTNPLTVGNPERVGGGGIFNHSQTLDIYNNLPLVSGRTYYFYVQSTDAYGNVAMDDNGGNFYQFTTTQDDDPPVISGVNAVITNNTQVAVNWTTDESSDSKVEYKKAGEAYSDNTPETVATLDNSHYVIISGLTPNTEYTYRVTSQDINGNSATAAAEIFTTTRNPEFQHALLTQITDVTESVVTDGNAAVTFNTDQGALCLAEVTTSSGNYTSPSVYDENGYIFDSGAVYDASAKFNRTHTIYLTDLLFSTPYYYKITCHDNLNTIVGPTVEATFTTLEKQYTLAGAAAAGDNTAPAISGISIAALTGDSATVTWNTDEKANSLIAYEQEGATFMQMAGDYLINFDKTGFATSHTVIINGLVASTKYLFTVVSSDAFGNISESSQYTFTTKQPSTLSSIKVVSTALGQATITWITGANASSAVEYGLTTVYGQKKEDTSKTKDHQIVLDGLTPGQTYHFRVTGTDDQKNIYASSDITFQPQAPPKISNFKVDSIFEHGATITYTTNVPTDSLVTYTDAKNPQNSGFQGRPEIATKHEIKLNSIASGTTFGVKVKVTDESGNSTEEIFSNFTTTKDETPPQIDQVKTDNALTQSDKVQTIISWKTDEQSTTALLYREGRNGEEKEYKASDSLSAEHIVVITVFQPGTVYNFRVKSTDASGNTAISDYYSFLTPRKQQNIIQIIIGNFQDIFGWMGNK